MANRRAARFLVLDEPTLGLDILYRKQFYDSLLNDYFDGTRTIVVTTHQVDEIQDDAHRPDVHRSRASIVLECSMEKNFESRYLEVMVNPEQLDAARAPQARSTSTCPGFSAAAYSCSKM